MWRSFAIALFVSSGYLLILLRGEGGHWGFGVAAVLALTLGAVSWRRHERGSGPSAPRVDPFDLAVYPPEGDEPVSHD